MKEQTISNLKKLKSFHNGSYGADINRAIQALEQQTRDCKTCKRSNNGECAFTEECHECMWESKYEQQPCEDCYYNDGDVHAECVVCNKAESEDKE